MARVIVIAALVLAVGAVASSGKTATEAEIERVQLYTACSPMDFLVEKLDAEASQSTDLTRKAIEDAVEARLRAARLFAPMEEQPLDRTQYLYINVTIVRFVFNIRVELHRFLEDLGYGLAGRATVWDAGSTGGHSGDGQYILGGVSEHMDRFIASYLRVNEAHCSR